MSSPRTLRGRLTLWMCAAVFAALGVFAAAAYVVVRLEETDDEEAARGTAPAATEDPGDSARDQVLESFAFAAPIALALSVLLARWASRRVIAPIDEAIQTAAQISVDRFDRRMELHEDAGELRGLAVAINDLLDRLQRGYLALAAFSADASHELRTPLAAVSNELEVALRRPRTPEEWEASARTSLAQLRRLGTVVNAMLRFAQADASRDADARLLDPATLIDEVVAIHAPIAARGDVALRVEHGGSDGGARVRGDEDLLATALSNLVGNAVRLTTRGGEVVVTLATGAAGVAIRVDDRGPGLPRDRSALFVPFARPVDAQAASADGGVGLGLAITRRIVERHGGSVAAADRPDGGGARFTIELPRAAPAD